MLGSMNDATKEAVKTMQAMQPVLAEAEVFLRNANAIAAQVHRLLGKVESWLK